MVQLDAIWNRARADLVVATEQGEEDLFLWEHSARVARMAPLIAKLASVSEQSPDKTAIVAAALYHDAGWVTRYQEGEIQRGEILVRPLPDTHREQSAALLEKALAKLVPEESLKRASVAVRSLSDRGIESIEGQVVAEADNLDEFGLLAFWPTIRRGALDGKGVQAMIETWRRRREYQFWTARLNDSFRFMPIRKLAEKRLASYEQMMEMLEEHHSGDDVMAVLADTPS